MTALLPVLVSACLLAAPTVFAASAPVVIRTHEALSLSPSGHRVADVEALDPGNPAKPAHAVVVVRSADGGTIAQYDPCRNCSYGDTAWSPDGDALAFLGTDLRTEKATLYVVRHDVARTASRIAGAANTVRWSPDGSRIALLATLGAHKKTGAFEAGAAQVGEIGTQADEQRIATVPASGGDLSPISPADTYIYEFDWMPDGRGFVATGAPGNGDNNWWIATLDFIDAGNGALRVIAAPRMQMSLPRVSSDGTTVAFVGGLMSDWGSIGGDVYTVAVSGGTATDATPDFQGTFRGLAWRGKELITSALIGADSAVVSLDPVAHATQVLWSSPVATRAQVFDGSIAFSHDGTTAASIVEDFGKAPEIALGRLPGAMAVVTRENVALRPQVASRNVVWTNDHFGLQGWLIGPAAIQRDKTYPMIVIVHGGPGSATTPRYVAAGGQHGTAFDVAADLVARGYFVFYPNPRGSFGQGDAFTRANIRDFGGGDLRDILAGVDAVEKIAPIDDARLGIYGHSYGGWMAMWANTQTHRFKAAVAGAGIANWTSYYGENGIDQWMIPFFGASVYADPAIYRAASPIEFIRNAKTPTLIYAGERDVECPAAQSLEYWHALKAIGTPTQLFIYAGEGHHFRDPAHVADLRARIVGWFDGYLK